MKRLLSLVLTLCLTALTACGQQQDAEGGDSGSTSGADVSILLADGGITVNGQQATGDTAASVYVANDIVFYPTGKDFTFGEGTGSDTHTQSEADGHTVIHITQPGTYALSGKLSQGQIAVDLGEDAEEDPNAVVTLLLNGVDITCTVAPAVIFYNVYECGDKDNPTKDVDTSAAGANVLIADGTENIVNGSYVARIYKPDSVVLSADGKSVLEEKKLHKYDGAFYSKMSMNVDGGPEGTGTLFIGAKNEGLDSEMHLTINGGNINIVSGNDGINTNEDGVSVTTINGGSLNITVDGATGEGDGIDSNGWLVINGGTVKAKACSDSQDSGIDSDMGIHINGGTVIASGHMLDRIEEGGQTYVVFNFASLQTGGMPAYALKNEDGATVIDWASSNDYSVLLVSDPELTAGDYTLWRGDTQLMGAASTGMMGGPGAGGGFGGPGGMAPPADGETPPDVDLPEEGGQMPDGFPVPGGMELVEVIDPAEEDAPSEEETSEETGADTSSTAEDTELPEEGTQMPDGFPIPGGMELVEVIDPAADGTEPPEGQPGQPPQMNEDGTITLPDGTVVDPSEMTPPDGFGGGMMGGPGGFGMGGQVTGELSEIFTIMDGGNMFSGVTEKTA